MPSSMRPAKLDPGPEEEMTLDADLRVALAIRDGDELSADLRGTLMVVAEAEERGQAAEHRVDLGLSRWRRATARSSLVGGLDLVV